MESDRGRATRRQQRVGSVSLRQESPHLVQGAGQQDDVVAGQEEGGHLGQFLDGRPMRVGHHLAERVH